MTTPAAAHDPDLCDDEGCPHAGTPHVCESPICPRKEILP